MRDLEDSFRQSDQYARSLGHKLSALHTRAFDDRQRLRHAEKRERGLEARIVMLETCLAAAEARVIVAEERAAKTRELEIDVDTQARQLEIEAKGLKERLVIAEGRVAASDDQLVVVEHALSEARQRVSELEARETARLRQIGEAKTQLVAVVQQAVDAMLLSPPT
jgi:chromosome segregation ATPase